MPIDPKVRKALEQRGIDSVRALLILHYTGSGTGAAITLGPGFHANRSDAKEWLREKDKQRARRERSDRRWFRINTTAASGPSPLWLRRVGVSRMGGAMISAVDMLAWHPRVRRRAEAARIRPEKPPRWMPSEVPRGAAPSAALDAEPQAVKPRQPSKTIRTERQDAST